MVKTRIVILIKTLDMANRKVYLHLRGSLKTLTLAWHTTTAQDHLHWETVCVRQRDINIE